MKKVVNLEQRPDIGTFLSQLLTVFGVVIVSTILLSIIGLYLGTSYAGIAFEDFGRLDMAEVPQEVIDGYKILQFFYQIGFFIIPAILLPQMLFQTNIVHFAGLRRNAPMLLFFLGLVLFFILTPLIEFSIKLNKDYLIFPESLREVEQWMKESEETAGTLTNRFIAMPDLATFLINTLLIAVLPAIAEELFFRGFVQKLFYYWWHRKHMAVIMTAFLFSFIHFQFYGFLPRMLLGLLLGYLYLWSRDLKLSIFVHFLNNFMTLLLAYLMQMEGETPELDTPTDYPAYIYFLSLGVGSALLYYFYRYTNKRKEPSPFATNLRDQEHEDWVKVFSTTSVHKAEIIKGNLKSEGIQAVILNKADSSYLNFGDVEIYVRPEDEERAAELIPSYHI